MRKETVRRVVMVVFGCVYLLYECVLEACLIWECLVEVRYKNKSAVEWGHLGSKIDSSTERMGWPEMAVGQLRPQDRYYTF